MKKQETGDIVFISSSAAKEPSLHLLLSNVFRVGVVALAKTLSKDLAADNIRVNTVNPGYFARVGSAEGSTPLPKKRRWTGVLQPKKSQATSRWDVSVRPGSSPSWSRL